jgi:membrane-associated phospholipid phosphatase
MPDHATDKPVEKSKDITQQAAKVETSSPVTQWYRSVLFWVGLLSAVGLFSMLTFLVETTPSFAIDLQITHAIQSLDAPFLEGFMRLISWPGFLPQSVFVIALIALIFFLNDLRWEAITVLLASLSSGVANQLVKSLIQRPRPSGDLVDIFEALESYSFPSGHVMYYTIVFGFVWYLVYTLLRRSWERSLLLAFFGMLILLVGVSRIYLGQHWASDVLGAYLLGGLILVGIISLHQWGKTRFLIRQSAASPDSHKKS